MGTKPKTSAKTGVKSTKKTPSASRGKGRTQKSPSKKKYVKPNKINTDSKRKALLKSTHLKGFKLPQSLVQSHIDYVFGRPTDYIPEMCVLLIAIMSQGRSFQNAATLMGISLVSAMNWVREFDEVEDPVTKKISLEPNPLFKKDFFKSYKLGLALSELWWDELGIANLKSKDFNNSLYMMFRTNKHGWTRRLDGKVDMTETKIEHTIHEDRTVVEHNVNIPHITEDNLAEVARILFESGAFKPTAEITIDAQVD